MGKRRRNEEEDEDVLAKIKFKPIVGGLPKIPKKDGGSEVEATKSPQGGFKGMLPPPPPKRFGVVPKLHPPPPKPGTSVLGNVYQEDKPAYPKYERGFPRRDWGKDFRGEKTSREERLSKQKQAIQEKQKQQEEAEKKKAEEEEEKLKNQEKEPEMANTSQLDRDVMTRIDLLWRDSEKDKETSMNRFGESDSKAPENVEIPGLGGGVDVADPPPMFDKPNFDEEQDGGAFSPGGDDVDGGTPSPVPRSGAASPEDLPTETPSKMPPSDPSAAEDGALSPTALLRQKRDRMKAEIEEEEKKENERKLAEENKDKERQLLKEKEAQKRKSAVMKVAEEEGGEISGAIFEEPPTKREKKDSSESSSA